MINAQNLLYSKSASARMEGVEPKDVLRLEVWHSVVFVIIRGRRPKFYSKTAFKIHFVEWRKAQARGLTATQNAFNLSMFYVRHEAKGTAYRVQMFTGGALCECEDFKNQMRFFGHACCKHIYSALAQLGHSSLSEHIAA